MDIDRKILFFHPPNKGGEGGPPMNQYEQRFRRIEENLTSINARLEHFATREDVANIRVEIAELKFTMLKQSIGVVVSVVVIITGLQSFL